MLLSEEVLVCNWEQENHNPPKIKQFLLIIENSIVIKHVQDDLKIKYKKF